MGKLGLAGTSLAAAIPGAFLFYILLMAVLKSLEPMPITMKVAALLMLVIALVMALFPAYLLIWFRRDKVSLASQKGAAGAAALAGGADAEVFAEDLVGQEFDDAEDLAPADNWADSETIGDDTESADGGLPDLDDVEAVATVDEDSFPTAEFEVDDDLEASFGAEDKFDQPAGASDDSMQTMEFEAEEVDEFGQTLQEFGSAEEEEFNPAVDFDDEFTFDDFEDDDDMKKK
ncbi:hypothetical protein SH661x_003934 [Planctomicrobium sp. SH661]|uniref:hypothetical protein n=1 Tax=Planctomicrobium sp. SH661 TaxID=3448124 RepID=UPI003F5C1952